ncbi:hypothetical protein T12_14120 [Trichinella patagoniensis]|uniref:Uncharacterized protein n=1 Tax=Trichinella patagoniensis TaxID=990121 RepID=A0A0V0Z5B7_9BILA|nr:hypothetical protein T12_14120 [Trichinella patagoniensis]
MCVGARLGVPSRRCVASRKVHRAIRLQDPPTLAEAHKVAKEERRQPHTGVMKQEKDDVTQHSEALTELGKTSNCSERPYEPLGELDASAAAAWTITDVTPPSYASENERAMATINPPTGSVVAVTGPPACSSSASQEKKGADDDQSQTTNCYCPSISQWMLNAV